MRIASRSGLAALARGGWLLLVLGATAFAASPLQEAKAHLAAGELDQVLFALDGKTFQGKERLEAARILAHAGRLSFEKKDPLFALQFAQMALRQDPKNVEALEVGARACFSQQQFTPAEQYADRWVQADPWGAPPRLLRAEIALSEGEWDHVIALTDPLSPGKLSPEQRDDLARLRTRAKKELAERRVGMSTLHSLDARMEQALARAKSLHETVASASRRSGGSSLDPVIVYGTSWCGYCKKAREYLAAHHIPFEDKDIEKDDGAADELARKAADQGIHPGGVPVIDVHGKLIVGFNRVALDHLLHISG